MGISLISLGTLASAKGQGAVWTSRPVACSSAAKSVNWNFHARMNYPGLRGLGHEEVQEAFWSSGGFSTTFMISREDKICAQHTGLTGKHVFGTEINTLLQGDR